MVPVTITQRGIMDQSINKAMGPVEWILFLILSFIWGASFFLGKVAVAAIPLLTIVMILGIIGVIIIIGPEVLKGFEANALAQPI